MKLYDWEEEICLQYTIILLVNIYACDITVYGCTAKNLDDQILTADLSSDWALTVQRDGNWLVNFNISKSELGSFHQWAAPSHQLQWMVALSMGLLALCVLGLKFILTANLKWNIWSIAKEYGTNVSILYCSRKYLTENAVLAALY